MNNTGRDTLRSLIDGSSWAIVAHALMIPSGVVTLAYLTRRLGTNDYGSYALAITLIMWIEVTAMAALGNATIRFVAEAKQWRLVAATLVRIAAYLSLTVTITVWLLADYLASWLKATQLTNMLRLASIDIPVYVIGHVHLHTLVGLGRFRQRAAIIAVRWVSRLLLILVFVELGLGAHGAIMGCIATSVVELCVCRALCRPPVLGRIRFPMRPILNFSAPLVVATLAIRLLTHTDLLILKAIGATAQQTGLYAAALNLTLFSSIASGATTPIILSTLSRLTRLGQLEEARALSRAVLRGLVLLIPFCALGAGSASEIAELFFGSEFRLAGRPLTILLLAAWSRIALEILTSVLIAKSGPDRILICTVPAIPLAWITYLVLIPSFGPMGAAWGTFVGVTVAAGTCFVSVQLLSNTAWREMPWISCLAIGIVSFVIARSIPSPGWWVVAKLILLAIFILVALVITGAARFSEVAFLRGLFLRQNVPYTLESDRRCNETLHPKSARN